MSYLKIGVIFTLKKSRDHFQKQQFSLFHATHSPRGCQCSLFWCEDKNSYRMCIFSAFVCGLISSADYIQVDTADTREPR